VKILTGFLFPRLNSVNSKMFYMAFSRLHPSSEGRNGASVNTQLTSVCQSDLCLCLVGGTPRTLPVIDSAGPDVKRHITLFRNVMYSLITVYSEIFIYFVSQILIFKF